MKKKVDVFSWYHYATVKQVFQGIGWLTGAEDIRQKVCKDGNYFFEHFCISYNKNGGYSIFLGDSIFWSKIELSFFDYFCFRVSPSNEMLVNCFRGDKNYITFSLFF